MKIYVLILSLVLTFNAFGQTSKDNIQTTFEYYLELNDGLRFNELMDYIVEDLFKIAPREELVKIFESMFHDPSIDIIMKPSKIIQINEVEKFGDQYYATLTYHGTFSIKMNEVDEMPKKDRNELINTFFKGMQDAYGKENVSVDKKTGYVTVSKSNVVCCVSKNGLNDWKFVSIEKQQMSLLQKFLPKEILDRYQ